MAYDQWDNALNSYAGQGRLGCVSDRLPRPSPREMTAKDLGLRTPLFIDQHGREWFAVGDPFYFGSDAPYSFWLGADA